MIKLPVYDLVASQYGEICFEYFDLTTYFYFVLSPANFILFSLAISYLVFFFNFEWFYSDNPNRRGNLKSYLIVTFPLMLEQPESVLCGLNDVC